ncbi:RNA polymerase sigma factor [Erythrobacter sp. JK5]|uniref:RNA polymerase sigma factor n=1 Tax=Erythrobacter sp. JK5 TaxID=2829500 RepID=UPI001BA44AD7|nr:sigma-70 family RNA polymerase sigma factor [Erythrobacter sp. JK5]QUL36502.1 sigma-70 family RNA polymerase sigma factor [Erythrobacter sp. JK5]
MTQALRPGSVPPAGAVFDELLVMLAQQGDKRALERLHARWNPRLARAALRYTGDADLARDLVQECWIGIWKGLGRLRDPARFRAYAFAVLHRRGADHLRRVIGERTHAAALADNGTDDPSFPAMQAERLALHQAFAALPPDQRLAAHLHFVEGLTLREIAEVQDVATGTAKSRLFHARRKLKAALSGQTPETTDPQGEPV